MTTEESEYYKFRNVWHKCSLVFGRWTNDQFDKWVERYDAFAKSKGMSLLFFSGGPLQYILDDILVSRGFSEAESEQLIWKAQEVILPQAEECEDESFDWSMASKRFEKWCSEKGRADSSKTNEG